jgi:hypothetical protein
VVEATVRDKEMRKKPDCLKEMNGL